MSINGSQSVNKVTTPTFVMVKEPQMPIIKSKINSAKTLVTGVMANVAPIGKRLAKRARELFIIAVLLYVAGHFAPELRQQMPIVYQFIDGVMTLVNFVFEWGLKLLTAMFTGKFWEINPDFQKSFSELLNASWSWMTSL